MNLPDPLRRLLPLLLAAAAACATELAPRTAEAPAAAPAGTETRAPAAGGIPREWAFPAESATPTLAAGGMVATTDPVASAVGADVLARGGNAVDAAVATHFALAVVNPEAGNLGGGGFLVARMQGGGAVALDFREMAPAAATADMYLGVDGEPTEASLVGHLAAGVPGSVAGMWEAHRRFGTLPWAELLAPAIRLADGLVVHERLASSLAAHESRLRRYPSTAAVFLPGGRAPGVGERWAQPDLAATLRRIAGEGEAGFYSGVTAELLDAEMRRGGGIMTAADLAAYRAVWRDPIRFRYRGYEVISMPPPSSGGVTLAELLGMLEGYELGSLGFLSAEHVHLFTEAAKRAYADRNEYLADPDFVAQPVAALTAPTYAARRRASIRLDRATPSAEISPGLGTPPREGENTTHYSIVDARGNAVAVTTTINSLYGNLVTVRGAGFLLNNEMDDFTAKPGVPNQFGLVQGEANRIEPGKRMLSAMTPTVLLDPAGRVRLVTGSPGGSTIITSVAEMVSNLVDWEMGVAEATLAPRLHHQHLPDVVRYERDGLHDAVVARLRTLGHTVEERDGYQGDVQSVEVLPDGTLAGMTDPRRGGAAAGVP
jgi:gamma-glutamyltranspeptidase/glutathione hydrolase